MRDLLKSLAAVVVVCLSPLSVQAQVDDAVPLANPSLAVNLGNINDWSPAHPFVNLIRTARSWQGHLPGQWAGINNQQLRDQGHVSETGWPLSIPDEAEFLATLILVDQPAEQTSVAGRYRLTFTGDAKVDVSLAARVISRTDNEIWFEFPQGASGPVMIKLTDMNPDDPLRDLAVIHERNILAHEIGATFNPDFVKHIRDFRVLRFMNWMRTNGSTVETWQDMPQIDDYSYATGAPLEVMIELANLVGADPWFTLPHLADDDLVQRFAETVKARLDPDLKAYVEYSNELWNFGFQQAKWAQEQAQNLWGGRAGGEGWLEYAGYRAAQVAEIVDGVYGDQAEQRLMQVIAVQAAAPARAKAHLEGRNLVRSFGTTTFHLFDAYALTGYLWLNMERGQTAATVRRWMSEGDEDYVFDRLAENLRNGALGVQIDHQWPEHFAYASANNLDMIMYEGGTHVIQPYTDPRDDEVIALLNLFNYSPQMDALYLELLDGWAQAGGALFNAYQAFYTPGRHGAWGHLRHLDDQTGRWDILQAHNRRPPKFDEQRQTDAFLHGRTTLGATGSIEGTEQDDILTGSDGDDMFVPLTGRDKVNGGEGVDQLMLAATFDEVSFTGQGDMITAAWGNNRITFTNIEYVMFSGDIFAIATDDLAVSR